MRSIPGRFVVPIIAALIGAAALPASADTLFPRPAGLDRDVAFWTRVYTEIGTDAGFVHDSHRLDIVYETLLFEPGTSARTRERRAEETKKRYRDILRLLASGKRDGLSDDAYQVLLTWGADTDNKTFAAAARHTRFQLGQADRYLAGIVRSGAWMAHIRGELTRRGLPQELAVVPHVESSFNPEAWSHAGAAGLWQITRPTGRHYLKIDGAIDERMDPFAATGAALSVLADNYRSTGTWPLALTAYNHGAAGMRRASKNLGTDDIETIVRQHRSRSFGFASRNFYVAFLAASDVERQAENYFGPIRRDPVQLFTAVELPGYYSADALSDVFGLPLPSLKALNPALQKPVWRGDMRIPRGYALRLPAELAPGDALAMLARIDPAERYASQVAHQGHRVRKGETLSEIARRYRVSVASIVRINNLRSMHSIREGQLLQLPVDNAAPRVRVASAPVANDLADGTYVVRSGDTLSHIARRFGMSERALALANNLSDRHRIFPGQKLIVSL